MPRNDGRTSFYYANWGPRKLKKRAHRMKCYSKSERRQGRRFGKGVKGMTAFRRSRGEVGDGQEQRIWPNSSRS